MCSWHLFSLTAFYLFRRYLIGEFHLIKGGKRAIVFPKAVHHKIMVKCVCYAAVDSWRDQGAG